MKTFRMIGMALFAVLMCVNLASCGGDDEEVEPTSKNLLIGTWNKVAEFKRTEFADGSYEENESTSEQFRLVFNSNNKGESYEYENGKWIKENDFTWELNGSKLYMNEGNNEGYVNILELTATKLVADETYTKNDKKIYQRSTFQKVN